MSKKRENVVTPETISSIGKCKGCTCKPNEYCEIQPKLAKYCKAK